MNGQSLLLHPSALGRATKRRRQVPTHLIHDHSSEAIRFGFSHLAAGNRAPARHG